jgi:hypothetical protein
MEGGSGWNQRDAPTLRACPAKPFQERRRGHFRKQLDLINRILRENNAKKIDVENLADQMFGGGVRTLNRMQASNLIDELFAKYPRRSGGGSSTGRETTSARRRGHERGAGLGNHHCSPGDDGRSIEDLLRDVSAFRLTTFLASLPP